MEQLGYIAVGAVLVLAALGLRRIRWSDLRLLRFRSGKLAWTPRTKNSILLSVALHAVLAIIGALFIVTKDFEYDAMTVEWVNLPRTLRQLKKPEVKPLLPQITPLRKVETHRTAPVAKPETAKEAARRSISLVERNIDLSDRLERGERRRNRNQSRIGSQAARSTVVVAGRAIRAEHGYWKCRRPGQQQGENYGKEWSRGNDKIDRDNRLSQP